MARIRNKWAPRVGEQRVCATDVEELLALSASSDADERLTAAELLCPCHLRKRVDAAWNALFAMMEDSDVRVRRAAWHTLEDGGSPDDPRLPEIVKRHWQNETDSFVRHLMAPIVKQLETREAVLIHALGKQRPTKGKCDFCGNASVEIKPDYDTTIGARHAWICPACAK